MINVRQKGANGEREIIGLLEPIARRVFTELGVSLPDVNILQRNQNQSAVGGSDLTNTFGLAIEVKRQENLAVPTWWKQTCASAQRNNERPVLIYRQNNKKWNVVMHGDLAFDDGHHMRALVQVSMDDFLAFLYLYLRRYMLDPSNAQHRV